MARSRSPPQEPNRNASTSRRSVLGLFGTVLAGSLAGCVSSRETDRASGPDGTRETEDPDSGDRPQGGQQEGWMRCRGAPISLERSYSDPRGYEDDLEYYPSNETVRVVVAVKGDEPVKTADQSFSEWASLECASVAHGPVRSATARRLGTQAVTTSLGGPPKEASAEGLIVWVRALRTVDTDEETTPTNRSWTPPSTTRGTRDTETEAPTTPAVSLPELARAAPKSARVTVTLEGDSYSRAVPVFADAR